MIISADCDLAQGKTGPSLVAIPIVGLHTYLKDVWLLSQIEDLTESCRQKLNKLLVQARGKQIEVRHALAWSDDNLASELSKGKNIDPSDLKRILNLKCFVSKLKDFPGMVKSSNATSDLPRLLEDYFSIQEMVENISKPGSSYRREVITNALYSIAQKDRADTWPLIDIIGMDPEMRDDEKFGFVSDMRKFLVVPVENIVTDRRSWMQGEDLYLRVCRLGSPYKMDFLQKFSLLFTRVGLDDRRSIEQKSMLDAVSLRIMPGE